MNAKPFNILLIKDKPGETCLVRELLAEVEDKQFALVTVDSIDSAVVMLNSQEITAILLDLQLPASGALDALNKISAVVFDIPIVVLSNLDDEGLAVKFVRQGAQDFLVKDRVDGPLLVRSLRYAVERKRAEERLHRLAHYDSLTGLANRKYFYDRLKDAMALARRQNRRLALLLLDLNDFKPVNDTFGHQVGDQLLQRVAERLCECVRETDCVARLGGDEFTMILTDIKDEEDAEKATCKILESLEQPFQIDGRELVVSGSIGISLYPSDADALEPLVRNADLAMYRAKDEGGRQSAYLFYSPSMNAKASARRELEEDLQRAMTQGEFVINYQPQVDIGSGCITAMESLLRWQHPQRGLLLPEQFMDTLESSDLILAVGEWVLRTVCRQNQAWQESGMPPLAMVVNVAPRQLLQADFADMVAAILQENGLAPQWLELDIPEHALWEDEARAFEQISKLSKAGVRVALDKFGHRRASFHYLRKFPFRAIKLDRAFTQNASSSSDGADLARAVIQVAHVFQIKGQAGGVETTEEFNLLRGFACDDAQGYLFCRPLATEAATKLLQLGQNLWPASVAHVVH